MTLEVCTRKGSEPFTGSLFLGRSNMKTTVLTQYKSVQRRRKLKRFPNLTTISQLNFSEDFRTWWILQKSIFSALYEVYFNELSILKVEERMRSH